ncbi:MAG: hypothetical protein MJZ40_01430 [Bacteroidaceae bacterium]|nr:hypothetical protein [Bacteroidaceae bacterium]
MKKILFLLLVTITCSLSISAQNDATAFEAQLQYNQEDNTVTITVNDESVKYFAFVDMKFNYDWSYKTDREAVDDFCQFTSRIMTGSQTISANRIYKDSYLQSMQDDLDYYFVMTPCTVDMDGYPVPMADAPIFKIEFHYNMPETTPLTFSFEQNQDGTITVTPSNNDDYYFLHVTSNEILAYDSTTSDIENFSLNLAYVILYNDVHKGETIFSPAEWLDYWYYGDLSLTDGTYHLLASKVSIDEPRFEGAQLSATMDGAITTYEFTVGQTTGVGTVLSPEATKSIYNLQGQRIQRQQRGINLVGGHKKLSL